MRFWVLADKHDKFKYNKENQALGLIRVRMSAELSDQPQLHTPSLIQTLLTGKCVFSYRPGRWSGRGRRRWCCWWGCENPGRGAILSSSSCVLLQHSQQHHTARQKVKGTQVNTHTHTHLPHHLSLSSAPSIRPSTTNPPTCLNSPTDNVKVNWPLILPKTTKGS